MNTLSSLLEWVGNTIGANPNTLTTSSKTIVGSINEVNAKGGTIHLSTVDPTSGDGANGDVWIKYQE